MISPDKIHPMVRSMYEINAEKVSRHETGIKLNETLATLTELIRSGDFVNADGKSLELLLAEKLGLTDPASPEAQAEVTALLQDMADMAKTSVTDHTEAKIRPNRVVESIIRTSSAPDPDLTN